MSAPRIAHLPGMPGATRVWTAPAHATNSDIATARTIHAMRKAVRASHGAPAVAAAAQQILTATPQPATREQLACAVFAWIRSHVRFVQDSELAARFGETPDSEIILHPARLLTMTPPQGDCDDFATLGAALLAELGVPSEFVTIEAEPDRPGEWSHVYLRVPLESGRTLPLDLSHGQRAGWEYPYYTRRKAWPMAPSGLEGLEPGPYARLAGLQAVAGLGETWGDVLKTGAQTGFQILSSRFSTPKGLYQQGADGSVLFRQPDGASSFSFPTSQISGAMGGNVLMIGLLALGAVLVIGAVKR